MKTCFPILLLSVLAVESMPAQIPGQIIPVLYSPLSQVKQFLQLTDSQLQSILTNNDDYNRYSFDKQNRIRQVQMEIADETGKSPLDPNALGIRYAEIETICREIKAKASTSQQQNVAVLTADQKAKLTVLTDAIKLAPVISEAVYGNLIPDSNSVPYSFTSNSLGFGSLLLGGVVGIANGCSLPFPVAVIRTGDFNSGSSNRNLNPTPSHWFDTSKFVETPGRAKQE